MGRPPKVSNYEILDFFIRSADPVFAPVEIADEFEEITKETARNRLDSMVSEGLLNKKKPSERVVMYWLTPKGRKEYEDGYRDGS